MYHARYGGSNAYRWTNCYGYLGLADTLPRPPTNRAAQEGSAQHTCMEMMLKDPDRWPEPAGYLNMTIDGVQITQPHVDAMGVALTEANTLMDGCSEGALIFAERFYTFEQGDDRRHPKAGGSADLLCIDRPQRTAVCADFKFGAIEVASGSTQPKFYFASAMRQHPELFEGIDIFKAVMIQPAFNPPTVTSTYTRADIEHFTTEFDIAIRQNERMPDHFNEGDWCAYCPAAIACPAKLGQLSTLSDVNGRSADLVGLGQWWRRFKELEHTADQIRQRLHHELDHGVEIEGLKLVARRTEAQWANPETTLPRLMELIPHRDAVRLLTPQAAQSIVPMVDLARMVHYPPGGTTIATQDDPRPAVVPAGALAAALRRMRR